MAMTTKEKVVQLIERLPEDLLREVQHYAEYLDAKTHHEEWSKVSIEYLAERYTADEVEYTQDDLKR
jgi:hypothetical protein